MSNYSGKERRVSQDEQLGYIRGTVEALDNKLESHMSHEENEVKEIKEEVKELRSEVKANTEHLESISRAMDIQANTHKYIWLTVKSVAGALFLAVTVKFGDIVALFK